MGILAFGPNPTPRSWTKYYLKRIDAIDGKLRAVIERNPDALSRAEALERQAGARGPLHGLPVLIKDNIAAVAPNPLPQLAILISPCQPASCMAFRSGCRFSARRGASPRCCVSAMPSSK